MAPVLGSSRQTVGVGPMPPLTYTASAAATARVACDAVPLTQLGLNDQLRRRGATRHPELAEVRAASCPYVVHASSTHDGGAGAGRSGRAKASDCSSAAPTGSGTTWSWGVRLQPFAAAESSRSAKAGSGRDRSVRRTARRSARSGWSRALRSYRILPPWPMHYISTSSVAMTSVSRLPMSGAICGTSVAACPLARALMK